jgi:hypothetical protein
VLHPLNKYLVVSPIETTQKEKPILLLPEDVSSKPPFQVVSLVQSSDSCSLPANARLVVPSHAIEQISIENVCYYLVLESFVVGYLSE